MYVHIYACVSTNTDVYMDEWTGIEAGTGGVKVQG